MRKSHAALERESDSMPKKLTALNVYGQLRMMILTFELYPGSRVTETELANHFEVSRTPIRQVDFDNDDRVTRTYREHFDIIQSLLQRDAAKARSLIKRHIIRSEEFAKTLTLTQLARKKVFAKRFKGA